MSNRKRELGFVFFKLESDKEPVRDWLTSLQDEEKKKIGRAIRRAQKEWPLGMPVVRAMGDGLFEIRVAFENTIARILFMTHDSVIVALHGFIKKSNTTPKADLDLAKERAKKVRSGNH